jgi:hypothetical protein
MTPNLKSHPEFTAVYGLNPPPIPDLGLTERPQALPDALKQKDPIKAYRRYYQVHKQHVAHWTKREKPAWFCNDVGNTEVF